MIVSGRAALAVMLVAVGLGFVLAVAQSPGVGGAADNKVVYISVSSLPENKSE